MSTVFERVRLILVDLLGVDEEQIQPTTSFAELNVDSLDLVEIVIRFEEEFGSAADGTGGFEITDEEARGILTVSDAVDYLKSLGVQDPS